MINCGQTCVAPDYVLCTKEIEAEMLRLAPKIIKSFTSSSEKLTRIINARHFERLTNLINNTKGKIAVGGNYDINTLAMDLTIVTDLKHDDILMKDEIFGPILPIITVNSADEAIRYINAHDRPLTLYVFSNDSRVVNKFERETTSGSICVNDTLLHMTVDTLPFGGVGMSGFGRYHGRFTFETFSHEKSILVRGFNPILEWVRTINRAIYQSNDVCVTLSFSFLRSRRNDTRRTLTTACTDFCDC